MPNFIGFNTIGQDKKFTLTDYDLIKRDILNAFNIRRGEMPGRPDVGSKIWEMVYDPNDVVTERAVENEIRRIIESDSRAEIQSLTITQTHNTINAEIRVLLAPDSSVESLYITFNRDSQQASIA